MMITQIQNYHYNYNPAFAKRNCIQSISRNLSFKDSLQDKTNLQEADVDLYSDEFISEEQKEKNNSQKKLLLLAAGIPLLAGGLYLIFRKSANKKLIKGKDSDHKHFHSLKDDKLVPCLENCKSLNKTLKSFLELQLNYSKATDSMKKRAGTIQPARGILMWGPPGTGKSFFAKIFAKTIDADYMEIKTADIDGTKFAGVGIQRINEIFEYIMEESKKRPDKKFVVTINEIDSLILPLESLTSSVSLGGHTLTKIEERSAVIDWLDIIKEQRENVIIIGTTNNKPKNNNIDSAILSRFGKKIELGFPDKEFLFEALKSQLLQMEEGKEFVTKNEKKLEKFSEELAKRKASFRDMENIINLSKNFYLEDMMANESAKFKFEYLEKGMNNYNATDGEIYVK